MIKWRKYQREVIELAVRAFNKGYKNVLIEAPTGFGKSLVNYYIAKHFIDAFYTTPQVVLLEQIEKDPLLDIAVVKGRANYPCAIDRKKTAANARCVTDRRFRCYEVCPYKVAKERAMMHPIAAMSFAYLIVDRFLPEEKSFGNRQLIIVDEADDIESWAEEFGSFKFKAEGKFEDIEDVVIWAKAVLKNVNARIRELERSAEELTEEQVKELEKLQKYKIKLTVFLNKVGDNPRNWVFEKENGKLIVKPVNVGEILNDLIWSRGKYRLASSATILDKEIFCKYNGLNPKETVLIRVPAIFKVENRPVYYWPVAKMTKEVRANSYGAIVDAIEKIANKHKGEKGLVHCFAYDIAREIYNRLSLERKVIIHDSNNRNKMFKKFIEAEDDAIFVSVGFARGVDLKYDLCRWQVITKVPFPDQSDIRVRELWVNRKAWNWARYQAIKNLVQAYGRIVRAEDDYGVTYVIDSSFGYLMRYKKQFPKWFLEAVRQIESLEEVSG